MKIVHHKYVVELWNGNITTNQEPAAPVWHTQMSVESGTNENQPENTRQRKMLRIDIHSSDGAVTLYCSGRLVYGVEVEMLRTMAQSRPEENIRIDLSAVNGIDASGLGLLVELQNWAAEEGRTLTLMDLSEQVWRLVILTKLCASLEMSYSDLEAFNGEQNECGRREMIA